MFFSPRLGLRHDDYSGRDQRRAFEHARGRNHCKASGGKMGNFRSSNCDFTKPKLSMLLRTKSFLQMFFVTKMIKIILHLLCVTFSVYCRHDMTKSLVMGIKEGTGEADNPTITRCVHSYKQKRLRISIEVAAASKTTSTLSL